MLLAATEISTPLLTASRVSRSRIVRYRSRSAEAAGQSIATGPSPVPTRVGERPRRGEGRDGAGVTEQPRGVPAKGAGAEDVVGMDMADGDIADRQIRLLPDGSAQPLAIGQAAAGIGHQHRLAPDDEA